MSQYNFPLISTDFRRVFFALIKDNICVAPMTNAGHWLVSLAKLWPLIGWDICAAPLTLTNVSRAYNSLCLPANCWQYIYSDACNIVEKNTELWILFLWIIYSYSMFWYYFNLTISVCNFIFFKHVILCCKRVES